MRRTDDGGGDEDEAGGLTSVDLDPAGIALRESKESSKRPCDRLPSRNTNNNRNDNNQFNNISNMEVNCPAQHLGPACGNNESQPEWKLAANIGGYQLDLSQLLGRGAFSRVFKGTHSETEKEVAVKAVLVACPSNLLTFQREVQALGLMSPHNHVVGLLDGKKCLLDQVGYLLLDYCAGGELFHEIIPNKGLRNRELVGAYYSQLISAINHVHSAGIAHLDVKPENILLDGHGNIRLCDFGLSSFVEDGPLTTCRGSFGYASPENLRYKFKSSDTTCDSGYDGQKADIWSCGVVLFVLLYGHTPWRDARDTSVEYRLYKITNGFPRVSPWNRLTPTLQTLFLRTLSISPNHRWDASQLERHVASKMGWHSQLLSPKRKKTASEPATSSS